MKKFRGIFLLTALSVCSWFRLGAQSYSESALIFSQINPVQSSRFSALGGAGVSLGGDLSAAQINPAGLGMFNKGEAAFSLGYTDLQTDAKFLGTTTNSNKPNLSIPFLGVSFHNEIDRDKIISGTFGITYSRNNNFNRTLFYQGRNESNSILDFFINDGYDNNGNAIDPRDLYPPTSLAFETYLIDTVTFGGFKEYGSVLDFTASNQAEKVQTSGSGNQWTFSYGLNIADRLFVGAGLGLRSFDYINRKTFTESGFLFGNPTFKPINNFSLEETLSISGSGYNLLLGIIGRPVEGLQLGASYESPSGLVVNDVYSASVTANWNNFDYYGNGKKINELRAQLEESLVTDYRLRTPGRLTAGLTYFFGKTGFITGEVETTDYSNAKYTSRTEGVSFDGDNASIRNLYRSTTTYRIGSELRFGKYRIRAGGSHRYDPFIEIQNGVTRERSQITGGFGLKEKSFNIDVTVGYAWSNQTYRPYRVPSAESPLVTSEEKNLFIQVTAGFPFR